MMTRDASKSAEQVPEFPGDRRAAPPSGDRLAADLRGFGPFGIVTILVIVLSGNVNVGNVVVPVGAILATAWAFRRGTIMAGAAAHIGRAVR